MKRKIPAAALLLIITCYVMQTYFGVNVSMRGFLLPQVTDYFNISYTSGGLIFLLPLVPLIFGSLLTGFIFSHYNKKAIALTGAAIMGLSILLLTFSPDFSVYLFFNVTMAFGTMIIFNVTNITTAEFFSLYAPKFRSNGLLLLHFFFGFGSISAMTAAKLFLTDDPSWQLVFRIMAAIVFTIIISFTLTSFIKTDKPLSSPKISELAALMCSPKMFLYGCAATFYVGSEFAVINWCPMFLERGAGETKAYSALVMMLFFLCFTGGRLLAAICIHLVNETRAIMILFCSGIISSLAAFVFRIQVSGFDLFIPLIGLCIAAIFPILQNHVIRDFEKQLGIATGVLYACANIGGSAMPFLIGVLNDLYGVTFGIKVTAGMLSISLISFYFAKLMKTHTSPDI